jgi:hypothetical protein
LLGVFTLVISAPPALSQSATMGALTDTVTDPSGAVPGRCDDLVTGQARTVGTSGVYKISLLPPEATASSSRLPVLGPLKSRPVTVNVTETSTMRSIYEMYTSGAKPALDKARILNQAHSPPTTRGFKRISGLSIQN